MFSGALLGLTAIGLSGDAFAASLARGVLSRKPDWMKAAGNGLLFGSIEGGMCLLGWLLASSLTGLISALDHWIAVLLLSFIGGRMIYEGLHRRAETRQPTRSSRIGLTLLTAIGTSIDSMVVGVAMHLAGAPVWSALVIGLTSTLISSIGFLLGPLASQAMGKRAEIAGGIILIGIGLTIWINHIWIQPG